jgi:2-polyprenyl-6-methoxyphenol hydroxylase-like FAD-dependent oxidoreductase
MKMPRALVIGGSIGGLFAANTLRSIGCEVLVLERAEQDLAGRGAGIGTHAELHAAMRRLGLAFDESLGVKVRSRVCLERGGRVSHEVAMPQIMTSWASIYRPLADLLPRDCYRAGKSLERIEQEGSDVVAVFADGTRASGDILVGADGIRSSVRAQLAPRIQPRYAGYIAWRGLVEERIVSPETRALVFEKYAMCLPEGEMMLAYPVPGRDNDTRPGGRACNFVWYRPADEREALPMLCTDASGRRHGLSIPPPLIRAELIEALRADARRLLAPQISELVERAQPFFQPIFDLESENLVFGRVALLGDAAFVARPHAGMGVTKAALDARCLAEALVAASGDVHAALERYQRERRLFGSRLVAYSRSLGAYLEAQGRPREQRSASELLRDPERTLRETGSPLVDMRNLNDARV